MTLLQNPHLSKSSKPNHSPPFISIPSIPSQFSFQSTPITTRRSAVLLSTLSLLPSSTAIQKANAFDFALTVPDQTIEEAENGIKFHAQSLLEVKQTLELESWKEAQRELRKSSSLLKQDLYTIIQAKPPILRPQLRNLYSTLFNSVTRLDYAARDKDVTRVNECYHNIVATLTQIFSILY